jgi:two-component system, OmpR family, phosphate regulon sensor histidine kinase PhoR
VSDARQLVQRLLRQARAGVDRADAPLFDALEGAVAALTAERDRFEAVLAGMNEGVLVLDHEGDITLANPAACQLMDLNEDPAGHPARAAIRFPAVHELISQAFEAGRQRGEITLPLRPPRRVMADATTQPATGGLIVVMHDVTALRRLETVRQDFVANVSHELRTPVTVIHANAETLIDVGMDDPEAAQGFANAILRNASRLSRLIADLLDIARIEAGEVSFSVEHVRVDAAIRRAMEAVQAIAAEKSLSLLHEGPDGLIVMADVKALDQVLLNLLDNAVKYTPQGGRVEVVVDQRAGQVSLEVRDDGPGIDAAHRERIFERFYRVDPGRSREMGGTGLGLSIVKHLVQSMYGQVSMLPNAPVGSVFRVVLPSSG